MKCDVYACKELYAASRRQMARSFAGTRHFSPEQYESVTFAPAKIKARSPESVMDMSVWSYVDDPLSAAWRSSVQRDREGANLGLWIVFPAFRPDTATLWYDMRVTTSSLKRFPLSSPFVSAWASGRLPDLGYAASHPFFVMSCFFTYHAWQEALTVVAKEHAVYKRVKVEGPFRPTRTTFTSCRFGSMSQWRVPDTIIPYSRVFSL